MCRERLKAARPTVATAEDTAGGDAGVPAAAPLLLGEEGAAFRFEAHAPVPVAWCRGSAKADGDAAVEPVVHFVTQAVHA